MNFRNIFTTLHLSDSRHGESCSKEHTSPRSTRQSLNSKPTRSLKEILNSENSPLVEEAALQTRAITRLELYKRISFSALVIAALLIWTGFYGESDFTRGIVGIVIALVFAPLALILHVGIIHAKKNVQALLSSLQKNQPQSSQAHKR